MGIETSLKNLAVAAGLATQPTRYMGIETIFIFSIRFDFLTQPTRYMGIET